jgi:hypothetical protein
MPGSVHLLSVGGLDCRSSNWRKPEAVLRPHPSGDYGNDCETGAGFALELLRWEEEQAGGVSYLAMIIRQMPRDLTGVEVGFLETIGYAAHFGLLQAERRLAYWKHTGTEEAHGALVRQRPDGSVVIEQPDGTRAVYRKEGAATWARPISLELKALRAEPKWPSCARK